MIIPFLADFTIPVGVWGTALVLIFVIPVILSARGIVCLIDDKSYDRALASLSAADRKRVMDASMLKQGGLRLHWYSAFALALALAAFFVSFRWGYLTWVGVGLLVLGIILCIVENASHQLAAFKNLEALTLPSVYLRQKRLATASMIGLDAAFVCCVLICWTLLFRF